jgi:outer membrane protein assembly factor BamD
VILVAFAAVLTVGCGGEKTLNHLTKDELFALGKQKLDNKKHLAAIQAFQTLVYTYPGDPIVDTGQYYLALSYFGNKDYELAVAEFNRLVVNYPASPWATQAQFMRAVSAYESTPGHYGLDQTAVEESIKQFEDFIIDHPESELVADANKYLDIARGRLAKKTYMSGLTYSRMGASRAAKVYYQKVIDDYTSSEFAPLASFNYAKEEMRLGNFDEARRRFENFSTVFGAHKLAPEAKAKAVEAAFRSALAAYEKRDFPKAAEKFEAFKKDFPSDERVKKADEYIARIGAVETPPTPQANAESK